MADDFTKFTFAKPTIPLIQIGLLTAIHSHGPVLASPHAVSFLSKYIHGKSPTNGPLVSAGKKGSQQHFTNATTRVEQWWHSYGSRVYRIGCWDWGPQENYAAIATVTPVAYFPVIGRVGYVCVMTDDKLVAEQEERYAV